MRNGVNYLSPIFTCYYVEDGHRECNVDLRAHSTKFLKGHSVNGAPVLSG
jgi:hypothetical protein